MVHQATVLAFCFVLFVAPFNRVFADELTAQKGADIRQLIEMTGASKLGIQMADAFIQSLSQGLKTQHPETSDRVITVIRNEVIAICKEQVDAPGGLMDQMIPVYDKYLTDKEIRELIAFYQTDTGKKVIEALPKITSEAIAVGQKWGQSLIPEFTRRLQKALEKEGIEAPPK